MFVGRSEEERALAREGGAEARHQNRPAAKKGSGAAASNRVALRLDRERPDDHGDFFVAYLIDERRPNDFITFGSRKPNEALALARQAAKARNLVITRTFKTDSASEDD
jgi:hypothetical protein